MEFFITLFFIYIIGVLFFRYLLPLLLTFWVSHWSKKMQQTHSQASGRRYGSSQQKHEGEITIDTSKVKNQDPSDKVFQSSDGEYVDFEEIKS